MDQIYGGVHSGVNRIENLNKVQVISNCPARVLLYCCAAVLLGNCWGVEVSFQNFSGIKILWGCRVLIENALGLSKKFTHWGHPVAPQCTPAGAVTQGVPMFHTCVDSLMCYEKQSPYDSSIVIVI